MSGGQRKSAAPKDDALTTRDDSTAAPPAAAAPDPGCEDLLDDAADLIAETEWLAETGWEPFALGVVEAARQRLDGIPLSDELKTLLSLANRLLAGRPTVYVGRSVIDNLPDYTPLDVDRPAEPRSHRPCVNHLALPLGVTP